MGKNHVTAWGSSSGLWHTYRVVAVRCAAGRLHRVGILSAEDGIQTGTAWRNVEKLVFVSAHVIVDPSSGAAVATNQAMQLIAESGFQCQAFTAAMLDFPEPVGWAKIAKRAKAHWSPVRTRRENGVTRKARHTLRRRDSATWRRCTSHSSIRIR